MSALLAILLLVGIVSSSRADSWRSEHAALFARGDVLQAIDLARAELDEIQAEGAPNEREVARVLHDLGVYSVEAGQFVEADSLLRRALEIRRQELDPLNPLIAETLLARIPALLFSSRDVEAMELAEEAHSIFADALGPDSAQVGRSLYWLGILSSNLGEPDRADDLFGRALEIQRSSLGPAHVNIAETLLAQGRRLQAQGRLADAERKMAAGLSMMRRVLAPGHIRLADGLYDYGLILRAMGDLWDASDIHEEEFEIRSRVFERNYELIRCLAILSLIHDALGHHEEAIRLCRRGVEDHRALYGEDYGWASLRSNLVRFLIHAGELSTAELLLGEVADESERLANDGVNTHALNTKILSGRMALSLHAGRYREAEELLLQSRVRVSARLREASQWNVSSLEQLAMARVGQDDMPGALEYLNAAADSYELARVRTGGGVRAATFASTPYEARAAVHLEMGRFEAAWGDLERARGRVLSDSLLNESVPFEIERVQATLRQDEAIVGWLDHEWLPGEERRWAYVLRSEGHIRWERLPVSEQRGRHAAFRAEIAALGSSSFVSADWSGSEETARELWRERFAPIEDSLEGVEALILIPSAAVSGLPVDALMDADGNFAGDRFAIRSAPSSAIHAWLVQAGRTTTEVIESALLLGDPAYRGEHLADWKPSAGSVGSIDVAVLRNAARGGEASALLLPRLPWSRAEVEGAAVFFAERTLLLGADASATRLRALAEDGMLARFDVLHLATHALVDPVNPQHSSLLLARVGAEDPVSTEEAFITGAEIEREWKLDADLVVLSACETALGRDVHGEGTVGLSYPLLLAGARSILASLWPVNDEATSLLMRRFYRLWLEGNEEGPLRSDEALRQAKRWLREWKDPSGRNPYSHPFYWAAFSLVGS